MISQATTPGNAGQEGVLYHVMALLVAGYPYMQVDVAKYHLFKSGRIAGIETISQPANL